ncbi:MAG: hypothetical protein AAGJ35_02290, partial [Myxococcota bacterium]
REGQTRWLLFRGKAERQDDVLDINVKIPRVLEGKYRLEGFVGNGRYWQSFAQEIRMARKARGSCVRMRHSRFTRLWTPKAFAYEGWMFTGGRSWVSDLPNHVYIWWKPKPAMTGSMENSEHVSSHRANGLRKSAASGIRWPTPTQFPVFVDGQVELAPLPPPSLPQRPRLQTRMLLRPQMELWPEALHGKSKARLGATSQAVRNTLGISNSKKPMRHALGVPTTRPNPLKDAWVKIREGGRVLVEGRPGVQAVMSFSYVPQFFQSNWSLSMGMGKQRWHRRMSVAAEGYQVLLEPHRVVVHAGERIALDLESVARKGRVFVDLVQHGRRLWSTSCTLRAGRCLLSFRPPKQLRGFVTVQAYSTFYHPGQTYDARLLYLGDAPVQQIQALLRKHLIARGEGLSVHQLEGFPLTETKRSTGTERKPLMTERLRALFALAKARFSPPFWLYDAEKDNRAVLREGQSRFRRRMLVLLGGVGGVVLLFMFFWMLSGYRADQRRIQVLAEEESLTLKSRGLPLMIVGLLVVALIFAAVLFLFGAMQWRFDGM